jgi:hypothetical protein
LLVELLGEELRKLILEPGTLTIRERQIVGIGTDPKEFIG